MHELSIALAILDAVQEQSDLQGGAKVAAVHVKLGPLSGVVKQALLSSFEMAREESGFEDCVLRIQEIPITIFCPRCQVQRPVESMQDRRCMVCGMPAVDVMTGQELEVVAMEVAA